MAKKQTRRSISVRGSTYYRLREYCDGVGVSMSDFIEQRIAEHLQSAGFQGSGIVPARPAAPPRLKSVPAPAPEPSRERVAAVQAPRAVQKFSEKFAERLAERASRPAPAPSVAAPSVIAPPAPVRAPIPATSTIVNKPQPIAALRATAPAASPTPSPITPINTPTQASVQAAAQSRAASAGRPAPTPAKEVLKDRYGTAEKKDSKDYRSIRF